MILTIGEPYQILIAETNCLFLDLYLTIASDTRKASPGTEVLGPAPPEAGPHITAAPSSTFCSLPTYYCCTYENHHLNCPR